MEPHQAADTRLKELESSHQAVDTHLEELRSLRDATRQTAENIQRQINVAVVDWLVEKGYLKKKWSAYEVELVSAEVMRLTTRPLTLSKAIIAYLEANGLLHVSQCYEPEADPIRLKGSRVDLWVRSVFRPDDQFVYEGWLEFSSLEDIKAMIVHGSKEGEGGPVGWLNFWDRLYGLRYEVESAREMVKMHRKVFERSQEVSRNLDRKLALMEETTKALKEQLG